MRHSCFLLGFAAALVLGGCQSPSAAPNAFTAPAASSGTIIHRDSGFSFPVQIGSFHRVMPHQYDADGRDVSVGYNHELSPQIVATIYVYPAAGRSLEQEFARRQLEVTTSHPAARLVSRGTATVTPRGVRALKAAYVFPDRFGGSVQPLQSILLVAQDGPRFVEYRFSYPAAAQGSAAPLAIKLAHDYAWRQ